MIKRAIANKGRTVRIPVHDVEMLRKIRKAERDLSKPRYKPTIQEIAIYLGIKPERVHFLQEIDRLTISLQTIVGDDEATLEKFVSSDEPTVHDQVIAASESPAEDIFERLLGMLSERDRIVIELRFGLDGGEPRTYRQIWGVLKQKGFTVLLGEVKIIEAQALEQLQNCDEEKQLLELFG